MSKGGWAPNLSLCDRWSAFGGSVTQDPKKVTCRICLQIMKDRKVSP